ncbi:MAG: excinuclease ABC subunit UvrC, partial [Pseudomonadota bacterium]
MTEEREFDSGRFLQNLTHRPGVYRMYDAADVLVYVGKAKDLKKRVGSYFTRTAKDAKTMTLVQKIARMEVTVTHTEAEALLLEHTLIKAHKPRFNVLLRDDKSYPWIYLNSAHDFPRLSFYRGPRRNKGKFFGPYPSAGAVRETLNELQKLFLLRPCRDSFFANRARPCLQYQINRCSGPCVGLIEKEAYAEDLANAVRFLKGKNKDVIERLAKRMDCAAQEQRYEDAARFRDQIARLKHIESDQVVAGAGSVSVDIASATRRGAIRCIAVLSIRKGRVVGSQTFFPRAHQADDDRALISAFLGQYYLDREIPPEIVIDEAIPDLALIEAAYSERSERRVQIRFRVRGDRAKWQDMARTNAEEAAALRAAEKSGIGDQLEDMTLRLKLASTPQRIECFDISHT